MTAASDLALIQTTEAAARAALGTPEWADAVRAHEEALFAAREAEAAAYAAYQRASDDLARAKSNGAPAEVVDSLTATYVVAMSAAREYGHSTA